MDGQGQVGARQAGWRARVQTPPPRPRAWGATLHMHSVASTAKRQRGPRLKRSTPAAKRARAVEEG